MGPHPLPLDPEREARARLGLDRVDDPLVARAALQVRRALLAHPGMASRSRWRAWAQDACMAFGATLEDVEAFSAPLWRRLRRTPPSPTGRSNAPPTRDPSSFAVESEEGKTFRVRMRAGTRDVEKSLLLSITALLIGLIGWFTRWGVVAQYLAPIGGVLLLLWSAQRQARRSRRWIFEVGPSGLLARREGDHERRYARDRVRYVDVVRVHREGAAEALDIAAHLEPYSQQQEVALVIGLATSTELQQELLGGPVDETTGHTVAHLLERELNLLRGDDG